MKLTIIFLIFCLGALYCSAQNTFPATGNAGIGTTTPGTAALAIQGSNNDGGVTNAPYISIKNTNTTVPAGNGYNVAGINLYAGNTAILGQLTANYGVGTAAPFNAGSGLYLATRTDHPIIFATGTGGAERMRITSTGAMGLGVSNPAAVLSLPNLDAGTNPTGITWYSGGGGDPTQYGIHRTTGSWTAPDYQQIRIGWLTGIVLDPGTAYSKSYVNIVGNGLRVTSGTVGIGTVNTNDANYKLFVETGIRTRKVKVDPAAWPDYVFNKEYRLPSLDSLAQFVKFNNHLPEIPSADYVQKEGLDLGDNQAALLKKIEELTLYLIDQNKKLKNQEQEIEELKKMSIQLQERVKQFQVKAETK